MPAILKSELDSQITLKYMFDKWVDVQSTLTDLVKDNYQQYKALNIKLDRMIKLLEKLNK